VSKFAGQVLFLAGAFKTLPGIGLAAPEFTALLLFEFRSIFDFFQITHLLLGFRWEDPGPLKMGRGEDTLTLFKRAGSSPHFSLSAVACAVDGLSYKIILN